MGPSPDAMASRASFRRKGPRSGLSRAESEFGLRSGIGLSGGGLLGDNLDREGEGEGSLFGCGEGGLELAAGSDLWDWIWVSGTEICSGAAPGGVLTETRPGIVTVNRRAVLKAKF